MVTKKYYNFYKRMIIIKFSILHINPVMTKPRSYNTFKNKIFKVLL